MTKTANSRASEANASNLSGSTGNTQETHKESASGHSWTEPPREEDLPNNDDIEYLARIFLQSRKEIDRQFHELFDGHVGFESSSNQKMFRLKLIYNELHHNISALLSQTKTIADNAGIKNYRIPEEES